MKEGTTNFCFVNEWIIFTGDSICHLESVWFILFETFGMNIVNFLIVILFYDISSRSHCFMLNTFCKLWVRGHLGSFKLELTPSYLPTSPKLPFSLKLGLCSIYLTYNQPSRCFKVLPLLVELRLGVFAINVDNIFSFFSKPFIELLYLIPF